MALSLICPITPRVCRAARGFVDCVDCYQERPCAISACVRQQWQQAPPRPSPHCPVAAAVRSRLSLSPHGAKDSLQELTSNLAIQQHPALLRRISPHGMRRPCSHHLHFCVKRRAHAWYCMCVVGSPTPYAAFSVRAEMGRSAGDHPPTSTLLVLAAGLCAGESAHSPAP